MLSFYFANRFRERQMYVSSGTHMTLLVRRLMANTQEVETEFLDGAYSFFNGSTKHIFVCYYFTQRCIAWLIYVWRFISMTEKCTCISVLERGTLQPDTLCDVNYNGLSSSSRGKLKHPGTEQIFWNVEGQMKCSQNLIPAANQSISIKVRSKHFTLIRFLGLLSE